MVIYTSVWVWIWDESCECTKQLWDCGDIDMQCMLLWDGEHHMQLSWHGMEWLTAYLCN